MTWLAATFLAGCASVREPVEEGPPAESNFVRAEVAIPGADRSYPVWRTRSPGPPVLLLHAINGLNADFLGFALLLEDWGYRVYLPSLYGDPILGDPAYGYDRELASMWLVRHRQTWTPRSPTWSGRIVDDVAAMARWVSRRERNRSVAVIGNSFTGGFPLALMDEPRVGLAVLGQPALPAKGASQLIFRLPQRPASRRSLAVPAGKWDSMVRAMRADAGKRIVGFHYLADPVAPMARFDELHERLAGHGLAGRFTAYVLSLPGLPGEPKPREWAVEAPSREVPRMLTPHSTFLDAVDEADRAWFRARLREELDRGW